MPGKRKRSSSTSKKSKSSTSAKRNASTAASSDIKIKREPGLEDLNPNTSSTSISTAASASSSTLITNHMEKLVSLLSTFASTNVRCSFALQALLDGSKQNSSTGSSYHYHSTSYSQYHQNHITHHSPQENTNLFHSHPDVNLILLTTFTMNQIIQDLSSPKVTYTEQTKEERIQLASVLASLCYLLSKILLSDRPRLDRCSNTGLDSANASHSNSDSDKNRSNSGGASAARALCNPRATVGHAIVSITVGSTLACKVLSEPEQPVLQSMETNRSNKKNKKNRKRIKREDNVDSIDEEKRREEEEEEKSKKKKNSSNTSEKSLNCLRRDGLWSSVLALEMMIHLSPGSSSSLSSSSSSTLNNANTWESAVALMSNINLMNLIGKEYSSANNNSKATGSSSSKKKSNSSGTKPNVAQCKKMFVDACSTVNESCLTASLKDCIQESWDYHNKNNKNKDKDDQSSTSVSGPSNKRQRRATTAAAVSGTNKIVRIKLEDDAMPPPPSSSSTSPSDQPSLFMVNNRNIPLESQINFDGRISVRRWGSATFVWLCQGQKLLLEIIQSLLEESDDDDDDDESEQKKDDWNQILESPLLATPSPSAASLIKKKNPKKSESTSSKSKKKAKASSSAAAAPPVTPRRSLRNSNKNSSIISSGGSNTSSSLRRSRGSQKTSSDKNNNNTSTTGASALSSTSPLSSSGGKKQKKQTSPPKIIPGNVARVALACRLIDLISESGSSCGVRAPTGGMDIYAAFLLGKINNTDLTSYCLLAASSENAKATASASATTKKSSSNTISAAGAASSSSTTTTSTRSSRSKKKSSLSASLDLTWRRPDIRNLAVFVTHLLIKSHTKCMNINCLSSIESSNPSSSPQETFFNVNHPQDSSTSSSTTTMTTSIKSSYFRCHKDTKSNNLIVLFYPKVHSSLEILGRAAASSVLSSLNNMDVSNDSSRLKAISCALIFSSHIQVGKILDIQLVNLAMNKIEDTVVGISSLFSKETTTSNNTTSTTTTTTTATSSSSTDRASSLVGNVTLMELEETDGMRSTSYTRFLQNVQMFEPLADSLVLEETTNNTGAVARKSKYANSRLSPCTFGGVFRYKPTSIWQYSSSTSTATTTTPVFERFPDESLMVTSVDHWEVLVLFLRACYSSETYGYTNEDVGELASHFISKLFYVLKLSFQLDDTSSSVSIVSTSSSSNSSSINTTTSSNQNNNNLNRSRKLAVAIHILQTMNKFYPSKSTGTSPSSSSSASSTTTSPTLMKKTKILYYLFQQIKNQVKKEHIFQLVDSTSIFDKLFDSSSSSSFSGSAFSSSGDHISMSPFLDSGNTTNAPSSSTTGGAGGKSSSTTSGSNKGPLDKRLWNSHIELCRSIGSQGLSSPDVRLKVFQHIARYYYIKKEKDTDDDNKEDHDYSEERDWPLCLLSSHHALMLANLGTTIDIPEIMETNDDDNNNNAPELYFCESFCKSLVHTVLSEANLEHDIDEDEEIDVVIDEFPTNEKFVVEEYIPLSFRDARVFVLAFGRLSRKQQIQTIQKSLVEEKLYPDFLSISPKKVSSSDSWLYARINTFISILLDIIGTAPSSLIQNISTYALSNVYHLPSSHTMDIEDCDWYNREHCFLGLLSTDWESPGVPLAEIREPSNSSSDEEEKENKVLMSQISKIKEIVTKSMELGFKAAQRDRCHLLYASWNAYMKVAAWDNSNPWTGPTSLLNDEGYNHSEILMKLRQDMCGIFRFTRTDSASDPQPDSLLTSIFARKSHTGGSAGVVGRRMHTSNSINNASTLIDVPNLLSQGLEVATKYIEGIVKEKDSTMEVDDDDKQEEEEEGSNSVNMISKFAVLEALPVYIAFLISQHTIQEEDPFMPSSRNTNNKKHKLRKNSSEGEDLSDDEGHILSDDDDSDDDNSEGYPDFHCEESDEDTKLDALARLHDACSSMSAAPCHPDWLDESCSYREGITSEIAIASAQKAIEALILLTKEAYTQYKKSLQHILWSNNNDNVNHRDDVAMALLSCFFSNGDKSSKIFSQIDKFEAPMCGDAFQLTLSMLCGISEKDLSDIQSLYDENSGEHDYEDRIQSAREAWVPNAAQYIRGKLHELSSFMDGWEVTHSEQLATGEWELLLAEVFLGSVLSLEEEPTKSIPEKWIRVLQFCTSSLVSSCALLRFGINKGRGQAQHPLSKHYEYNTPDMNLLSLTPLSPVSPSPFSSVNTSSMDKTISKALTLLSELSSDGLTASRIGITCQASAIHLVNNPDILVNMNGWQRIRNAKKALVKLSTLGGKKDKAPVKMVTKLILQNIQGFADFTVMEKLPSRTTSILKKSSSSSGASMSNNSQAPKLYTSKNHYLERIFYLLANNFPGLDCISNKNLRLFDEPSSSDGLLSLLVNMLCGKDWSFLDLTSKTKISSFLHDLLQVEQKKGKVILEIRKQRGTTTSVVSTILQAWNQLSHQELEHFITQDLCLMHLLETNNNKSRRGEMKNVNSEELCLSRNISNIIRHLLCSLTTSDDDDDDKSNNSSGCRKVLSILLQNLEKWTASSFSISSVSDPNHHIMDILCLLATRFSELNDTGTKLLSLVMEAVENTTDGGSNDEHVGCRLRCLERFYRFVKNALDSFEQRSLKKKESQGSSSSLKNNDDDPDVEMIDSTTTGDNSPKNLLGSSKSTRRGTTTQNRESFSSKLLEPPTKTCSYVETGGEFTEQHWYICYTCDLLWDKGCCSLCAQVCHRGHDVGYSRKSSFFCDCGADVQNSSSSTSAGSKVTCKCLSPVCLKELEDLSSSNDVLVGKYKREIDSKDCSIDDEHYDAMDKGCQQSVSVAIQHFPKITETNIYAFVEMMRVNEWTESMFKQFNRCFENWAIKKQQNNNNEIIFTTNNNIMVDSNNNQSIDTSHIGSLERLIEADSMINSQQPCCIRDGKQLELKAMSKDAFVPVRAAKSSTVNMKLSLDSTTDRLKKNILSKREIYRRVVVTDSRGRMIIAEPCSLLFCCPLPLVNTRHVPKTSPSSPISTIERSELCILGTDKVKSSIVGMELCPLNERHLITWGSSEACVVIISKAFNSIEKKIELIIDLEPHECDSEFLLKCEWVPGSETLVLVACGTFIKIFDIKKAAAVGGGGGLLTSNNKEATCRFTSCSTLAYEDVLIRSTVFIGFDHNKYSPELMKKIKSSHKTEHSRGKKTRNNNFSNTPALNNKKKEYSVQLVLLMDTGRLHLTDIRVDSNGELEDQGETYIECEEGLRFPVTGVRRYIGASPSMSGTTSTSFGEGSGLAYLYQSDLLLYKCISAPLLAMKLNKSGRVIGSFELLPHVITSSMLESSSSSSSSPSSTEGHSISAPYSHFVELGVKMVGTDITYCIACVGKSTRTNQPKLLYVEFNEKSVSVKELSLSFAGSSGLGLGLSTSIEGLAAFSSPYLTGKDSDVGSYNGNKGKFVERCYLASVYSNGTILFFGENIEVDSTISSSSSRIHSINGISTMQELEMSTSKNVSKDIKTPSFPLTIFESLINISDSDDLLTYGGDCIVNEGSANSVKKKVKISNTEYITCPYRVAGTLSISLKPERNVSGSQNNSKNVIVAIRILVGNTATDSLPRYFNIMGRKINVRQGMKRWYDMPLTDEEISLAVRCGFVLVGIGDSFELSNCVIVDAVEVYAKKRDDLEFLNSDFGDIQLQRLQEGSSNISRDNDNNSLSISVKNDKHKSALISSILCVTHNCRIIKEKVNPSLVNDGVIQRLVQMTALDSGKGEVRDYVLDLLQGIEPNVQTRQSLLDEGTLLGVAEELVELQRLDKNNSDACSVTESKSDDNDDDDMISPPSSSTLLGTKTSNTTKVSSFSPAKLRSLAKCLKATLAVVTQRPKNYKLAIEKLISTGKLNASIALEANGVFDAISTMTKRANSSSIRSSAAGSWNIESISDPDWSISSWEISESDTNSIISYLVELALFEIAIVGFKDSSSSSSVDDENNKSCSYASFKLLSDLLLSADQSIVKQCCTTIAKVLIQNQKISSEACTTTNNNSISQEESSLQQTQQSQEVQDSKNNDDGMNNNSTGGNHGPIAYQCDSCRLFPITSIRYTLEGEDIDLCKVCFDEGCDYSRTFGGRDLTSTSSPPVKINGRLLRCGTSGELTCQQISSMQAVPVESQIIEQVEIAALTEGNRSNNDANTGTGNPSESDRAERNNDESMQGTGTGTINNDSLSLTSYMNQINFFDLLLDEAIKMNFFLLEHPQEEKAVFPVGSASSVKHLFQLLLHLTENAESTTVQFQRGKKIAESVSSNLSRLVSLYLDKKDSLDQDVACQARISMIISLKTLGRLRMKKDELDASNNNNNTTSTDYDSITSFPTKSSSKEKTDPRFKCSVHGIPGIRRRCSTNQNRRFYVCGMDRKSRCDYFQWADEDKPSTRGDSSSSTSTLSSVAARASSSLNKQTQSTHQANNNNSNNKSDPTSKLQAELLKLFCSPGPNNTSPLQSLLCDLLQININTSDDAPSLLTEGSAGHTSKISGSTVAGGDQSVNSKGSTSHYINSLKTGRDLAQDWLDGVMISKKKLTFSLNNNSNSKNNTSSDDSSSLSVKPEDQSSQKDDSKSMLVQSSLEVLSHLATNSMPSSKTNNNNNNNNSASKFKSNWSTGWFSLLCEITSTTTSGSFPQQRALAKNMLKKLCGGRKAIFHRVRDHYVFSFQFQNLLQYCGGVLQEALEVKEQTRQCGPNWNVGDDLSWSTLSAGALLGVEKLISEDSLPVNLEEKVKVILDELIEVTKSRGGNWRQLCAMPSLLRNKLKERSHKLFDSQVEKDKMWLEYETAQVNIFDRPPIFILLWMACSLTGENQVKVLHLIDVALTHPDGSSSRRKLSKQSSGNKNDGDLVSFSSATTSSSTLENLGVVVSTDGGNTDFEGLTDNNFHQQVTPERVLLYEKSSMAIRDVHAFILQFVLHGKSSDLRDVASSVAKKVLSHLKHEDINSVLMHLMHNPLEEEISKLGRASFEFLKLLQDIIKEFGSNKKIKLDKIAKVAVDCFVRQMNTMRTDLSYYLMGDGTGSLHHYESNSNNTKDQERNSLTKIFDLSTCIYCQRDTKFNCHKKDSTSTAASTSSVLLSTSKKPSLSSTTSSSSVSSPLPKTSATKGVGVSTNTNNNSSSSTNANSAVSWHPNQIRPFTKSRVESLAEKTICAEFAQFVRFKSRLAISEVHLTVSDPRGRFIKTIGVYFSPRQVSDISELKSDEYSLKWQRCGTISLGRGALRGSCKLSTTVVASNLKLEYQEFYDKATSSSNKSSEDTIGGGGGMILTCPRCTRVVNNAHGVCGHCGEVAFQCRKCRHINYDRLDAFLCVECGYCASGGFSYELTSGMASNAVSILDDEGYDRAVSLHKLTSKKVFDLKHALKTKILSSTITTGRGGGKRKRPYSYPGADLEDDIESFNKYGSPALKRALVGELPKVTAISSTNSGSGGTSSDSIGTSSRRRTAAAIVASRRSDDRGGVGRIAVANNARSLLSLARQLRNDSSAAESSSGSGGYRSSTRGDMLIRQALLNVGASSGGIEFFDDVGGIGDEGDIFGLINQSSADSLMQYGIPDPLSRLVANIQARVRSSTMNSNGSSDNDAVDVVEVKAVTNDGDEGTKNTTKATGGVGGRHQVQELEKLHQRMRESERECHELVTTINAWNSLNRGESCVSCGVDFDDGKDAADFTPLSSSYVPTTCSCCSESVSHQFLILVMRFLETTAIRNDFEFPVTNDLIRALFDDYNSGKISNDGTGGAAELRKVKRQVIVKLVTNSDDGAKLVYDVLKLRLSALKDHTSAEILGAILEKEFKLADQYVSLAMEVLGSE